VSQYESLETDKPAKKQRHNNNKRNMPKQKNPNKTNTRRKEEAAVKGEGATGPSQQLMIETIPPHTSVELNQSAM
jgi:hypothetical protein